ncbi:calcium-binding mitochondrial carrier protein SCaMC-2-like isoform X2 [Acanthaster planci]|uniref:Calcium-binding mitochondrial carrier protein SCaMC-2-like isoform X2 n=1 Tax=Acanthaster planci TaxID=133434 RepID=A0A8B7XZL5_ACAPL|nr:calcium-binding mitochondrial carrier protein SCaMC-2-like isoform X2 [Acanthaster planci]
MPDMNENAASDLSSIHPQLTPEDEARYAKLFEQLDVNADGRIDVEDLQEGLERLGVHIVPGHAQKFMSKSDQNKDGHVDFAEFLQYVTEHEKQLKLVFKHIDHNQDGHLDVHEILASLRKLGVSVSEDEADRLMKSMDKDGSLKVDWNEWRNYLLLHPSSDLRDIYTYWKHATFIDIGETLSIPDEFSEDEKETGRWWRILLAGGAAGAVSRTVTAPLDRLKVIFQVIGSKKQNLSITSGFQHMYREGGLMSMWRGNGINVLKIAPETALKFFAYEHLKKLLGIEGRELRMHHRFMAGSMAGVFSQTVIYPMEVLKTRLAIRKTGQYKGILDCALKVYRNEGLRCFYKGYLPNILGIIPYAGIDLAVYETVKNRWLKRHQESSAPPTLVLLACGTFSSTCGQIASYPLALVRTRLQAQLTTGSSMVGLFSDIYRQEGIRGLYRGIAPNFMKVAPAVSIGYVVYENVRQVLGVNK